MPNPQPTPEPALADPSPAAVTRRALAWSALGLVLAGGAVARLTGSAGQAAPLTRGTVALPSLTEAEAAAALPHAGFDPPSLPAMLAAIRQRRLHLVRAAFYGVGAAVGTTITVTCGSTTRPITLTLQPTTILLPIEREGTLVVTQAAAAAGADARIGLIDATGPGLLPPLPPGRSFTLDVIVL